MLIDVVYNHLGPKETTSADFGPYFSRRYKTPWGEAINYDGADSDPVRAYFRDNALAWLTDFHVDGLRFDAIQTIFDRCAALSRRDQRRPPRARTRARPARARHRRERSQRCSRHPACGAQWLWLRRTMVRRLPPRSLGRGDREPATAISRSTAGWPTSRKRSREGYVYDGVRAPPPQTPRQVVGRRARAQVLRVRAKPRSDRQRTGTVEHSPIASPGLQRLAAAILFSRRTPMLFMGQEWGETAPFDFFTSHSDADLVAAVRRGARGISRRGARPRPGPPRRPHVSGSKIDWSLLEQDAHRRMLRLYRELIALRRTTRRSRADGKTSRWYDRARTRGG